MSITVYANRLDVDAPFDLEIGLVNGHAYNENLAPDGEAERFWEWCKAHPDVEIPTCCGTFNAGKLVSRYDCPGH